MPRPQNFLDDAGAVLAVGEGRRRRQDRRQAARGRVRARGRGVERGLEQHRAEPLAPEPPPRSTPLAPHRPRGEVRDRVILQGSDGRAVSTVLYNSSAAAYAEGARGEAISSLRFRITRARGDEFLITSRPRRTAARF